MNAEKGESTHSQERCEMGERHAKSVVMSIFVAVFPTIGQNYNF